MNVAGAALAALSYAKTVQVNAMTACFQIAERSLSYAKTVQVNAMTACFQIAERSLVLCKDSASECNDSLLSDC